MKKIFNWTIGSFFRTIGRVIAFIFIGLILSYIINSNDLLNKLNLDFLTMKVSASVNNIELTGNEWLDINLNTSTTPSETTTDRYVYNIFNQIGTQEIRLVLNKTITSRYFGIPFGFTNSTTGANTDEQQFKVCSRYSCTNMGSTNCSQWTCTTSTTTNTITNYYNDIISEYNFNVKVQYTSGSWFYCTITNNEIICPSDRNSTTSNINYISIYYTASTNLSPHKIFLGRSLNYYETDTSRIENSINNQTQQQHQDSQNTQSAINNVNDTLTDDDTSESTSEASNFFGNFTTDTHGLTGVITAPLSAIQSLTSKSCTPLVIPIPFLNNKNLTLPCMRSIYIQYFGDFMNIYDVICLGVVSYWIMVRIFNLVKDFKNPDHDEIEVMDL